MTKSKIEPWVSHPHIWKTKSEFFNYIRGGLRRGLWERYPIKLEFKNKKLIPPPPEYKGKGKSGYYCDLSGEFVINSKLEVDHIIGNVSLNDWDDLLPFITHLLLCQDNLQLVSKEAHKIKSYAERWGLSYEQAKIEKQVAAFKKKKAGEQVKILSEFFKIDQLTNSKKRINLYRQWLKDKDNG